MRMTPIRVRSRDLIRSVIDRGRRQSENPRRLARGLWIAVGLVMIWAAVHTSSTTGDAPGIRRFRTPEVTGNVRLAQRFRMHESRLTGVAIYPAVAGSAAGALRLTLTDLTTASLVRSADVAAADVVRDDRFVFSVGRVDASMGHWFELAITASPEEPATGVAFWATKGDRLEDAMLIINGHERWADLAFRTQVSPWLSGNPFRADSGWQLRYLIAAVAMIALWGLIGVSLRIVATISDTSPEETEAPEVS
jgi:hypothetical protein